MAAGSGECLVDSRHPAVCKTLGIHAAKCLVFVCNMFGFYLTKHKLHAETKDMADGAGVRFCVYNSKTGEKVAEPAAKVNGSKADAEWTAKDMRKAGDTDGLKYYFEATAPRAKKIKSSNIEVKNPQVVSMEWDKKACFWGNEIELTIKTFEMNDLSPDCTVNIWEEEKEHPDKLLLTSDAKLDKDEVKVKFTLDFDLKNVSQFDTDDDYRFYAVVNIPSLGKYFRQEEENYLFVSNDF